MSHAGNVRMSGSIRLEPIAGPSVGIVAGSNNGRFAQASLVYNAVGDYRILLGTLQGTLMPLEEEYPEGCLEGTTPGNVVFNRFDPTTIDVLVFNADVPPVAEDLPLCIRLVRRGEGEIVQRNQQGYAWCLVSAAGAITFQNGAVASVTRLGAGVYEVIMDDNFRLAPDDLIDTEIVDGTADRTIHVELTVAAPQTTFQVRVTDGTNGGEVDQAWGFRVTRTQKG